MVANLVSALTTIETDQNINRPDFCNVTTSTTAQTKATFEARSLECIRDDRVLFDDLCFTISPGEALVLEGRNGSGKTSLLRIICGIRLPESGQVLWEGEDIFRLGPEFREHIAYLGHKDGSKQDLTPLENLRIAQGLGKAQEGISLDEALEQVGLGGLARQRARTLSGGEAQRVALARAMVLRPDVLLLDEPTANLDPYNVGLIEDIARALNREHGTTLVLVTHNVFQAKRLAHRVALLLEGQIVEIADTLVAWPLTKATASSVP